MSETKNWRSTRSYGVILTRFNLQLNAPEYLMVCRKSTFCYVDFILGKYDDKNIDLANDQAGSDAKFFAQGTQKPTTHTETTHEPDLKDEVYQVVGTRP